MIAEDFIEDYIIRTYQGETAHSRFRTEIIRNGKSILDHQSLRRSSLDGALNAHKLAVSFVNITLELEKLTENEKPVNFTINLVENEKD